METGQLRYGSSSRYRTSQPQLSLYRPTGRYKSMHTRYQEARPVFPQADLLDVTAVHAGRRVKKGTSTPDGPQQGAGTSNTRVRPIPGKKSPQRAQARHRRLPPRRLTLEAPASSAPRTSSLVAHYCSPPPLSHSVRPSCAKGEDVQRAGEREAALRFALSLWSFHAPFPSSIRGLMQ